MIFKSSKSDLLGLNGSSPLVDQLYHAYFYRRRKMQMISSDFEFDSKSKFATSFYLQSKQTNWTEVKNWALLKTAELRAELELRIELKICTSSIHSYWEVSWRTENQIGNCAAGDFCHEIYSIIAQNWIPLK